MKGGKTYWEKDENYFIKAALTPSPEEKNKNTDKQTLLGLIGSALFREVLVLTDRKGNEGCF